MTLLQKIRLFQRLVRLPIGLAVGLLTLIVGHWFAERGLIESSPAGLRMVGLLINLLMLVTPVALVFSCFKLRRGLHALHQGKRLQATVIRVRLHVNRDEDEPLYVIDWRDDDGNTGSSLPGELHEFVGYKKGVRITVFRNNRHDSWWERDILDN